MLEVIQDPYVRALLCACTAYVAVAAFRLFASLFQGL